MTQKSRASGPTQPSAGSSRSTESAWQARALQLERENTELRRAQVALVQSRHRMADGYEQELRAMQGRWLERLVTGLPTPAVYVRGERIWLNAAAEELIGYRTEELPTLDSWFDTLHGERGREQRALHDRDRIAGFPASIVDDEIRTRDGRPLVVEVSAYQYGDHEVFFLFDVTARRKAEAALKESESRLRTIVETAGDAILTFDADGSIVSANPAAEKMFGYSAAELKGRAVSSLADDPAYARWSAAPTRTPPPRGDTSPGIHKEVLARRRDRTTFPVEFVVSSTGNPDLFTVIIRDVSERRRYESLVADVAAAEQARIGRDLHDIVGQTLVAVALSAERASRQVACEPGTQKLAEVAEAIRGALADVRTAARGLTCVADDAQSLVLLLQELAATVEATFGIECRLHAASPEVVSAEVANHLYRIASEAVNNAVRHADAGRIDLCLETDASGLLLRVDDDGVGISSTTDHRGIGTSIMRNRAAAIGADFRIEPGAGGGTVVTCRLPTREHGATKQGRP